MARSKIRRHKKLDVSQERKNLFMGEHHYLYAHDANKPDTKTPFFMPSSHAIAQAKPVLGTSHDVLEKKADKAASNFVNRNQNSSVQKHNDEDTSQAKYIMKKEEDKKLRKKGTEDKDKIHKLEEDKKMQKKEEDRKLQRKNTEDKDKVHKKEEDKKPQKKEEDKIAKKEEDKTRAKLNVQRKENKEKSSGKSFDEQLKSAKSGGFPLPEKIKLELERHFGKDFREVRIHTDDEAVSLCHEINAQAFTHGFHIYFSKGKYNPESSDGKHLLVHELAHVIQQNG